MAESTYDFKKLGAVDTVDEIQEGDTVLVERGGSIYRVAGGQVGGAGGYLLELEAGDVTLDSDAGQLVVTKDVTDMVAAYQGGWNVVLKLPLSLMEEETEEAFYASLVMLADMGYQSSEYAGLYFGAVMIEGGLPAVFTNGNPLPTEASATSLNLLGGAKPVATEASDGEL